jgi:hypothetical protein
MALAPPEASNSNCPASRKLTKLTGGPAALRLAAMKLTCGSRTAAAGGGYFTSIV